LGQRTAALTFTGGCPLNGRDQPLLTERETPSGDDAVWLENWCDDIGIRLDIEARVGISWSAGCLLKRLGLLVGGLERGCGDRFFRAGGIAIFQRDTGEGVGTFPVIVFTAAAEVPLAPRSKA